MNLADMKEAIILLALVAFIGSATAIALGDFQSDTNDGSYICGTNGTIDFNVTCNGLDGVENTTGYLDTIGTMIGISVLIGIVILAFVFGKR